MLFLLKMGCISKFLENRFCPQPIHFDREGGGSVSSEIAVSRPTSVRSNIRKHHQRYNGISVEP